MKIIKICILSSLLVSSLTSSVFAQSTKKPTEVLITPSVNRSTETITKKKTENEIRFVVSGNLSRFLEELNKYGKSGYRVDKAFSFGNSQNFAAILKINPLDTFEYDLLTSPNKKFLESRLNFKSEIGFNPVQTLAITTCYDNSFETDKDISIITPDIFKFDKGDIFLLERVNGIKKKTKDYKVFIGEIGLGKSPSKELQTALDNTSKEYRPFKVLFNKGGFVDFSVSILLEDDLNSEVSQKVDYKFVKEVNGFEKEINSLAKSGYKFLSGRRIGLIKYALMAKISDESSSYVFIDQKKYQKDFDKEVKSTYLYANLFIGDSDCDSPKTNGGKLIFEEIAESKPHNFKFLQIKIDDTTDLESFLKDGYKFLDIFYSDGFVALVAK